MRLEISRRRGIASAVNAHASGHSYFPSAVLAIFRRASGSGRSASPVNWAVSNPAAILISPPGQHLLGEIGRPPRGASTAVGI